MCGSAEKVDKRQHDDELLELNPMTGIHVTLVMKLLHLLIRVLHLQLLQTELQLIHV